VLLNTEFLLDASEPWVVYRTLIDLFGFDEADKKVKDARAKILQHPLIKGLLEKLRGWPGTVLNSHKSAGQLYHKLSFLADVGLKKEDADLSKLTRKLARHISEDGLFQLPTSLPVHFGGTGREQWAWALCDAPLLMSAAVKMGLWEDKTGAGLKFLSSLARENGWPCKVSKELGKFRGPGKRDDPCPYASLLMLKWLALFEELRHGREARIGVDCLLGLWEKSPERHPYMFFMGTDFRKLKVPFIWYDILHVADVLSRFDFAAKDTRFARMLEVINSKADAGGLFTPESEWQAWKDWEFAGKKKPSAWLTFLVYRINKRCDDRRDAGRFATRSAVQPSRTPGRKGSR
jgi:hypothetical protein